MDERFLQYVWANSLFRNGSCRSSRGKAIQIRHVGQQNRDAGPDFYNAKIEIDGTLFVGTVEIHAKASDWFRHGHDHDPAYGNVILSVVEEVDREVVDCHGRPVESIVLEYPESLRAEYLYMQGVHRHPRCHRRLWELEPLRAEGVLAAYAVERLERKCEAIREELRQSKNDWESCFYHVLARYWAGNVNREACSQLAVRLPYKTILRCGEDRFRVEALLLGVSGLLESVREPDDYVKALQEEYAYQAAKYRLESMTASVWKFMRVRPAAFPTVRLALLAALMCRFNGLFSRLMEGESIREAKRMLDVEASDYWITHYQLGVLSPGRPKQLGEAMKEVLLINALIPFMFVYGRERHAEHYREKALCWLEELPAERNRVTRAWEACGFHCRSALHTQALLEIEGLYCENHRCLECRVGDEVFRSLKG